MDVEAYTSNDPQTVTASFGSEQKTLQDTSTAAWSGSYTPPTTTTAGEYQMNFHSSDALGNTATMTLPYTIYPAGEPNTPTQTTTPETPGNPTPPHQSPNSPNSTPSQQSSNGYPTASATSTSPTTHTSSTKGFGQSPSDSQDSSSGIDLLKIILKEIFGSPDLDIIALLAALIIMASTILAALLLGLGFLGGRILAVVAAIILSYFLLVFMIAIAIICILLLYYLYNNYRNPPNS